MRGASAARHRQMRDKLKDILLQVQKPARYVGGEYNLPDMDKECSERVLLCFSDKYEVYNWMYDNIWSSLTHKVITCLNYEMPGYVRDYAIAAKIGSVVAVGKQR